DTKGGREGKSERPTGAGVILKKKNYMVEYPYGCTEQTLNRFLRTAVTIRTLSRVNLDLKEMGDTRAQLRHRENGDHTKRDRGDDSREGTREGLETLPGESGVRRAGSGHDGQGGRTRTAKHAVCRRRLGLVLRLRRTLVAFFFQAEDGIRDWSVTGVQTCALPI